MIRPACTFYLSFLLRREIGNQEKVKRQWLDELHLADKEKNARGLSRPWAREVCG